MTIVCAGAAPRFFCPTKWQLFAQLMALLPRGRAWQTHEAVAEFHPGHAAAYGTVEAGGALGAGAEGGFERLSVLQQYWAAVAEVLEHLHQRACALLDEMFCASTRELGLEWGADYGFPDPCEPWDTLCAKVAAEGGATCGYLAELASRLGFKAYCADACNAPAGCGPAGCVLAASGTANRIHIVIVAAESPAMTDVPNFAAGCLVAGGTPPCPPVPEAVICLIERFKPAHVMATYEVI
jgi:uncharacterized protein YmfQ (DUF2313 family)